MLTMLARLLKILNSEAEPHQISLAFCFAMIAGFTPLFSLHNLLVIFCILILRVNLSGFLLGLAVFSGVAYILDPVFSAIGYSLLTASFLDGLWTSLYNMTLFRLENFNNSIVMGSLVISILLFVPFYFLFNNLINKYREHFLAWIEKTKLVALLKSSKLYSVYQSVSGGGV